jgi:hypothetical protein
VLFADERAALLLVRAREAIYELRMWKNVSLPMKSDVAAVGPAQAQAGSQLLLKAKK